MNAREWFEGVLGYRLTSDERNGIDYWESSDGMMVNSNFDGTFLGNGQERMIREFQSEWIEHVVKPMRGFGYLPYTRPDMFIWAGERMPVAHEAEIIDDQIFQASLNAAEKCPEVKEKLEKWRNQ